MKPGGYKIMKHGLGRASERLAAMATAMAARGPFAGTSSRTSLGVQLEFTERRQTALDTHRLFLHRTGHSEANTAQ